MVLAVRSTCYRADPQFTALCLDVLVLALSKLTVLKVIFLTVFGQSGTCFLIMDSSYHKRHVTYLYSRYKFSANKGRGT